MLHRVSLIFGVIAVLLRPPACLPAHAAERTPSAVEPAVLADQPQPYMRVRRDKEPGQRVALQIASRKLAPAHGSGPAVWLVAVVHVGEPEYYAAVQKFLDTQDLVLYEGVGRPAFMDRHPADDTVRIHRTREAMEYLASLIDWYRQEFGPPPLSMRTLRQAVRELRRSDAGPLLHALTDGWGREFQYRRQGQTYTLISFGADGRPGGEDAAADIIHAGGPRVDSPSEPPAPGVQDALARGLGLVFQLDAIDYEQEHFINSDLSLVQIQRRIARTEGRERAAAVEDPGAATPHAAAGHGTERAMASLARLLDGSSLSAGMLRGVMGMVEASPRLQATAKILMIEMLGHIDGDLTRLQGLTPAMKDLLRILIHDRNQVVVDDLAQRLKDGDRPRSIAILYGAGHMHDLEHRIRQQLDYEPRSQFWLTAFSADPSATGLSPQQIDAFTTLLRVQIRLTGESDED